ncbi:hypothetical protein OND23_005536 [Klebsiella oxytoca]
MTNKPHGLTGKRNAAKPVTASAQLQIRMTPLEKAHFSVLAEAAGLTLSAWTLEAMRAKAEKQITPE